MADEEIQCGDTAKTENITVEDALRRRIVEIERARNLADEMRNEAVRRTWALQAEIKEYREANEKFADNEARLRQEIARLQGYRDRVEREDDLARGVPPLREAAGSGVAMGRDGSMSGYDFTRRR
jgi:hypothetical protein